MNRRLYRGQTMVSHPTAPTRVRFIKVKGLIFYVVLLFFVLFKYKDAVAFCLESEAYAIQCISYGKLKNAVLKMRPVLVSLKKYIG